jgi:hypothetical protein
MSMIKGTSISLTLDLVRERAGEEGIALLVERLPPPVRQMLPEDMRPLATELFPFEAWAEILIAAEALFGHPRSIVRESSRRGYKKLLATTYRMWVKEGDPIETVRRIPRLWQQVTTGIGTLAVEDRPDGLVVLLDLEVDVRYRGVTEERVAGTIEAMIEAAGGTGSVTIVRSDGRAEYQVAIY